MSFAITNEIIDSIANYAVAFTRISGNIIMTATCTDGACELFVNLSFSCALFTNIDVTVSAISKLGQGPPSNPILIGIMREE